MNFQRLTWPQVVLLLGGFAGAIVAYRMFGPAAAGALTFAMHAILAASTPKDPPSPPGVTADAPSATPAPRKDPPVLPLALVLALFAGCAPWTAPDVERLRVGERKIDACEERAADAGADAWEAEWNACRVEVGLP